MIGPIYFPIMFDSCQHRWYRLNTWAIRMVTVTVSVVAVVTVVVAHIRAWLDVSNLSINYFSSCVDHLLLSHYHYSCRACLHNMRIFTRPLQTATSQQQASCIASNPTLPAHLNDNLQLVSCTGDTYLKTDSSNCLLLNRAVTAVWLVLHHTRHLQ